MNHPTTELLDAFIEGWLESIVNPPCHSKSLAAHCGATKPSNSPGQKPNWDDMPTPPPSSPTPTQRDRRSPKRPRRDDNTDESSTNPFDQGFTHDSPFDNDKTPSASSRTHNLPAMSLPARPLLGQTPSLSSTSSAQSATRSSSVRSMSPVKRSTLQLLKKPIHYVSIDDDPTTQLPDDILPTYDRITDIVNREGFLPRAVEEKIRAIHRRNTVKNHWFFDHADDDGSAAHHMQEFIALCDIEQAAKACQTEEASESAWNLEVHGPLLKLALAPFPSLSRDILTQARISKPFVPEMQAASHYDFTRSKMIDWGIRVHPPPSTSARIRDVLLGLPFTQRCVNQTTYGPVRFDPVGISIETKIGIGATEEARLQLGVWVAAWHQRISMLINTPQLSDPGLIITLPLILIIEHEWRLLFACDKGDRIEIIEDITIGDTKGLVGVYTILATIRVLASWMQDEYGPWIERWLGVSEAL